jgi:transcription elongation factor S-II
VALMLGDAVRDPSPLFDLGRSIEDAAWRAFAQGGEDGKTGASSPEYRACSRTLAANLRRNPDLRQRMLTGEWTPKQLVEKSATPDALATDALRNLRREMDERSTRKRTRQMGLGDAIATDKYRCRDCLAAGTARPANNCAYFNLQNHRDVRKNETWGSKDSQADDGRVLVRCLECKAEWNEATL